MPNYLPKIASRVPKRALLATLAATIAATTVTVIFALAQGGTAPPPAKAPGPAGIPLTRTNEPIPGTPVASLAPAQQFGRLRILPYGSVPQEPVGVQPPKAGLKQARVDNIEKSSPSDCASFNLSLALPTTRRFTGCSVSVVTWEDGETSVVLYTTGYGESGHSFGLTRQVLAPGESVDVMAPADDGRHGPLTVYELNGHTVTIYNQIPKTEVYQITFVTGDVMNQLSGMGIDLSELLNMAKSVIAQSNGG